MVFRKVVGLMMGCLGLSKQPTRPVPFAENSGSLQIDQIVCNSPRIRLSDGRFLAYRERGFPKNRSNYIIIVVHGFGSSKEMNFMASQLADDKTAKDYNIEGGSVLHLVLALRGDGL